MEKSEQTIPAGSGRVLPTIDRLTGEELDDICRDSKEMAEYLELARKLLEKQKDRFYTPEGEEKIQGADIVTGILLIYANLLINGVEPREDYAEIIADRMKISEGPARKAMDLLGLE